MPSPSPAPPGSGRYGPWVAISVVVANMIGTGVFTSLGFQLLEIRSTFALLLLWVLGGMAAFSGAVCYAELGAAIPRSGGEYAFLSRIYHPTAGFASGIVSATVGFAAPTALAAMTFASYLASAIPALPVTPLAAGLVLAAAAVHMTSHRASGFVQSGFTAVKVVLIVAFCAAAATMIEAPQPVPLLPTAADFDAILGGAFAVSLIYVSYAYTGWNAATYITGELTAPGRNLPRVLAIGTLLVTLLYVALNHAFLRAAPMDELAGRVEIGYVAATFIFGPAGATLMAAVLALLLISTVSAMVIAGPRVVQMIGRDYPRLRLLGWRRANGIPVAAIAVQTILTLIFVLTASFEQVLVFTGFVLGLNSFATVAGLIVLRMREGGLERPYRCWGYPATPLLFLALTGWTLFHIARDRPAEVLVAAGLIAGALLLYRLIGGRAFRETES